MAVASSSDVYVKLDTGEVVVATPYHYAVSGHHIFLNHKGQLWKQLQYLREARFYNTIEYCARHSEGATDGSDCDNGPPLLLAATTALTSEHLHSAKALFPFIPKFFGTRQIQKVRPVVACRSSSCSTSAANTVEHDFDSAADHNAEEIVASFRAAQCHSSAHFGAASQQKPSECLAHTSYRPAEHLSHPTADHLVNMIVLEDLCYGFVHPCVLDLKMGTRQYGVNATAEKRSSKIAKAMRSTSSTLGLRISGYKKWDIVHQVEEAVGKGQTKEFKADDVQRTLFHFLNGDGALINAFLKLSRDFEAAFQQQTAFRFFTSSVLLLYDAERPLQTARLVMVDFAYTYCAAELIAEKDEDANLKKDDRYFAGVESLCKILGSLSSE